MISDDERREVAARLREYSGGRKAFHLGRLCAACGIDKSRLMSRTTDADAESWDHLADLIEPPAQCPYYHIGRHRCSAYDDVVDRDALLDVCREIEEADVDGCIDWADRIRKAIGEE